MVGILQKEYETVDALRIECQQDQQSRNGNGTACFELIRRALDEDSAEAWTAFEAQFKPLIQSWIRQKTRAVIDEDLGDDLWSETRERFVRYVKLPLDDHYPHIGSVLNYWRQCAYTTAIEFNRKQEVAKRGEMALAQELITSQLGASTFEDSMAQRAFLDCLRELIAEHIDSPELQTVLYLRFELELSPRVIAEKYPDQFPTARVVYNKVDVIKKRLKRIMSAYLTRCL